MEKKDLPQILGDVLSHGIRCMEAFVNNGYQHLKPGYVFSMSGCSLQEDADGLLQLLRETDVHCDNGQRCMEIYHWLRGYSICMFDHEMNEALEKLYAYGEIYYPDVMKKFEE